MGKRLYVGSLPFGTTDAQLQEVFAAHGQVVSAKVIVDRIFRKIQKVLVSWKWAPTPRPLAAIQKVKWKRLRVQTDRG